ncbi:MAG: hypothetical protein LPK49_09860 [Bacteroidota bacterium]|nr:hypothetical protein [Bacteroidota bacterium]MDX5431334.1 hypothetical protein [Bacteroidota bacterium]
MSRWISLINQEGALRSYFPDSEIKRKGDSEIRWTSTVTPTPLSADYNLHLHYKVGEGARVYVLSPMPLRLAEGKTRLPHVYNHNKQWLCLYYPDYREWNPSMYYVHTLIPWACEWLMHYELWVGTGDWTGGGIEHEEAEKDRTDDQALGK